MAGGQGGMGGGRPFWESWLITTNKILINWMDIMKKQRGQTSQLRLTELTGCLFEYKWIQSQKF